MKEIRNFKGEIVKTEAAYGERGWHLSSETWMFLSGIVILTVTLLLPAAWFNAALHSLDVRVWTWRHFVLAAAAAGYAAGCWHIRRSWDGYDEDEKRHAMEQNALRRAKPQAKREIADIILSLVPASAE